MSRRKWLPVFCFLFLLVAACSVQASYKDVNISDGDTITFTSIDTAETIFVHKDGSWDNFADAVSSDDNVATVYVTAEEDRLVIDAVKMGTCTITVTDKKGQKKDLKVVVTKQYESSRIGFETDLSRAWYGTRAIEISTVPNCKGTLKIRGDVYKFSVGKSGEKTVRLKRVYKLNEKLTLTLQRKGAKCVLKRKLNSQTFSCSVNGRKKEIRVDVSNLHKGDVIQVKHRGKTYKKSIPRDFDDGLNTFTFKTKKTVNANGDKIRVTIFNKAKKILDKHDYVLANGGDDIYDDEGDHLDDEEEY